jgi:hypothetical protein
LTIDEVTRMLLAPDPVTRETTDRDRSQYDAKTPNGRNAPKKDLRLLRLAHDVSALRSVCASMISGNSGVGEKPLSADASTA